MNIKDIVNRDIVNLTNCENEPIHIPGSIQPHGFLLGINSNSFIIDFSSGNTAGYINTAHTELIGMGFLDFCGSDNAEHFREHIAKPLPWDPLKMTLKGSHFQCSIHLSGNHYIFEAEPDNGDEENLLNVYNQTLQFVSYMSTTNTLKDLCQLVAEGTRSLTGYDRVMIYRFDKEYNGEVFAESCNDNIEPFLGLHYPHTDIPVQARELYLRNLLRLIVDVNYTPVPIYTMDDIENKNLDLSVAILRSTSPIHVEYLQNVGVGATLTISLIHQGRLWGLLTCHHYSQKNINAKIRLAAQLQGQFITSQIDVRQSNEEYEIARKTNIAYEKLTAYELPPIAESFKIISLNRNLLELCNASGVSLLISGKVYKNGITPSDDGIKTLSDYLSTYSNDSVFFTNKLINFVPDLKQVCETVSGIIYHSLGNNNSIIWYRPESLAEVNWAGNPEKAIIKDSRGLHPRNSFNLWKQVIKCRSTEWRQPELNTAANYAHTLQKQISMLLLSNEEEKYRNLSEILKETNAELENINWISTHDLQEPLRKIQLISSMLIAKEGETIPDTILDGIQRMNGSANRMQTLLTDILKYTRIKYIDETFETVALNSLTTEVIDELSEIIKEKSATVTYSGLPSIKGIPFLLKQLFSNIILNSLKYAAAERDPVITITASDIPQQYAGTKNKRYHTISFSDNGIGFEQQYAESIFNIFTRLHGITEYKGSGVGLALCKKIMQTHHGNISAIGNPGNGTVITLYFPAENNH